MISGTAIAASCGCTGFGLGAQPGINRSALPFRPVTGFQTICSAAHLSTCVMPSERHECCASLQSSLLGCVRVPRSHAASVGTVTKVENQAQIGSTIAVVGSTVQTNDRVQTGPKARLEITFRDDTKLSVGENAEVVIDRFVYNPDQSTGELVLSTGAAAYRMVTGKIGKMQNKTINVSTPFCRARCARDRFLVGISRWPIRRALSEP